MKTAITAPLLALAGVVFFHQAIACSDDPADDLWVELDCEDYCERANECDADTDVAECENDCLSALANCQADEREAAQEQLEQCADVACDDLLGCSIDAGAQCYFGL